MEQLSFVRRMIEEKRTRPSRYLFSYQSPERRWTAPLIAVPCIGCRRLSSRCVPYCTSCLKLDAKCELKRTMLTDDRGRRFDFMGLFAFHPKNDLVFKKGQTVLPYLGELKTTEDMLWSRYGNYIAPYGFGSEQYQLYTDSALLRGAGANINTGNRLEDNNLTFVDSKPLAEIVATRDIYNGEELLLDYGPHYTLNDGNIMFKTKVR